MADLVSSIVKMRDTAWLRIKTAAKICADSTTLEQTIQYLQKGETLSLVAARASEFSSRDQKIRPKLETASSALKEIHTKLSKAHGICQDITAASEIARAIAVLTEWRDGKRTSAEGAQAFDLLFGGASRFAEKLGPPLSAYSLILKQAAISKFFTNIEELGDPLRRNTPSGNELRKIWSQM